MPAAPHARSTRRTAVRKTTGRKTAVRSNTAVTSRRRKSTAARRGVPAPALVSGFPSWADLGSAGRKKSATRKVLAEKARHARFLDATPSLRFGVWVLVLCIAATLYVGHVFATQETFAALQQAERENLQLLLTRERLQGAYDQMTGPDPILARAAALGLEEGIAYGPPITLSE